MFVFHVVTRTSSGETVFESKAKTAGNDSFYLYIGNGERGVNNALGFLPQFRHSLSLSLSTTLTSASPRMKIDAINREP